jgi:hypothetical protein
MVGASSVEVLRAEDHVVLRIDGVNLVVEPGPEGPRLARADPAQDAFLIVGLPPQSIVEQAYQEGGPAGPAGTTERRASGPSRVAFRVPDGVNSIPFSTASLLDWTTLEPHLPPQARALAGAIPDPLPTSVSEPAGEETAIELPYRIVLSQGPDETWLSAHLPVTLRGATTLWHARLAHLPAVLGPAPPEVSPASPGTARAVWSPDYAGPAVPVGPPGEPGFRTELKATYRSEIVSLSSDYRNLTLPPSGFHSRRRRPRRYVPTPGVTDTWLLSSLGAWLHLQCTWGGNDPSTRPRDPNGTVFGLSGWKHVATQGRDHYVKIAIEGALFPFGHRATWVLVTERRFETGDSANDPPVARLREYSYVLVRQRERSYDPASYLSGGRENPLGQAIRITTVVTPHLLSPGDTGANGATPDVPGTGGSVWALTQDGAPFPFQLIGIDSDGESAGFDAALIFVPDEDATGPNAPANLQAVQAAYVADDARRRCPVPDRPLAFAPSSQPGRRDAVLSTQALHFDVQLNGGSFLPVLDHAEVRVDALHALLGGSDTVAVKLYSEYLASGLDPHAGVFAELINSSPVGFAADRAGGLATPNLSVTGLGRASGIVSGPLSDAVGGMMSPAAVFSAPDASMFGVISLKDLLQPGGGLIDAAAAPTCNTVIESLPGGGKQSVTSLTWTAPLHDLLIFKSHNSTLNVSGKIVQPLPLPGTAPVPPTSTFKGSINDFDIELAEVISVSFASFTFTSVTGQKTDTNVSLKQDPGQKAITFTGALSFVNTLADVIPPGLFGDDGPSIDVTPTGLDVSYSIGLPSLSVGVFSLEHVSLGAGLQLPFLTGRPQLDFSFASRDHPFLLTVSLFGGGGFVHVTVDASGPIALEASLEFGGEFSLDIGVASGGVSVMAGIYFKLTASSTELDGFVDIHGEVCVLGLVSVCVDFNLTLGYKDGKAFGRAEMTVSVHVACFSKGVTLSVERSFGGSSGDPRMVQLVSPGAWASYAEAFA